MRFEDVDMAKVSPCANGCGTPVRRFAAVPIRGTGLDGESSGPWWCPACLKAKIDAALVGVEIPNRKVVDVGSV